MLKEQYQEILDRMDNSKVDHENGINEKEALAATRLARDGTDDALHSCNETITSQQALKLNNNDIFSIRPKRNKVGSKSLTDMLKCEYSDCTNINVDLIRCNLCGKRICEECSDLQVTKLKPLMIKCRTLYFSCKGCDTFVRDTTVNVNSDLIDKITSLEKDLSVKNVELGQYLETNPEKELISVSIQTNCGITEAYDKLSNEHKVLDKKLELTQASLDKKTHDYARLKGENNTLCQQIKTLSEHEVTLRDLLEDRENTLHATEEKLNAVENSTVSNSNNSTDNLHIKIQNLLTTRLNLIQESTDKITNQRFDEMEKNIDQLITKKIEDRVAEGIETRAIGVQDQNQSYANSLKNNQVVSNFESIIKTTKNNELVQEKEREKRSANLIVYGIKEVSDDQGELRDHDNNFIPSFLETIGVSMRPKHVSRLGKTNEKKLRPVKLVMDSSADKESVMSRLGNLKNADIIYRSLSVRDDYTIEERELIKDYVKKADDKNKEENTQQWKVRGTPKNGLRLVKITKQR